MPALLLGIALSVVCFVATHTLFKFVIRRVILREFGEIPGIVTREMVLESIKQAEKRIPWHTMCLPPIMFSILVFLAYVKFVMLP